MTSWTQSCIKLADVILMFADAKKNHLVSVFEEQVEAFSLRVSKKLVLCHNNDTW